MKIVTGIVCGLFAVALAGCTKEQTLSEDGMPRLQVVGVALEQAPENTDAQRGPQTRATEANNTFTFENGDALSLFMRGTKYDDVDNRKVSYSKPGAEAGTWTIAGNPIYLHNGTAVVSLIYPHAAANVYNNIPFTTGVYEPAKDLLWKQQDVYAAVHEARVELMHHALTRVKILLKRDDPADVTISDRYTGAGAVTSVSLSNGAEAVSGAEAIFTAGVLDLSFTAPASPVTGTTAGTLADNTAFTLPVSGHTTDLLTLPAAAMTEDLVTLSVAIDGKTMTTSLPYAAPADKWLAGSCYIYTVTVKRDVLVAGTATIGEWIVGGEMEGEPMPAHALEVDQNGILTVNGKMLFFQFGSVVGFTQEGDPWNKDAVLFNPVTGSPDYAVYAEIPVYADVDFNAGYTNVSEPDYHKGTNVKAGKGDPCRLVGLSVRQIQSMTDTEIDAYNSGWRLPTNAENQSFTGVQGEYAIYEAHWTPSDSRYDKWYYSTGSAGGYFPMGKESEKKNYLPAAGMRRSNDSTYVVASHGNYWSSEAKDSSRSTNLTFEHGSIIPLSDAPYAYGFGARCVRAAPEWEPLKVDQNGILTVGGKMLFFQLGSVVGFTQEGAWSADKVLFDPVTGSQDYTNYTNIPVYAIDDWNAGCTNISDPLYHNGTNVKAGKGDPCKLAGLSAAQIQSMTDTEIDAHNSGWRLPTLAENLSFTGLTANVSNYTAHWTGEDLSYDKWYYSGGSAGGYFPKGEESKKLHYLPAAGHRGENGSPGNIGSNGSYWSSEPFWNHGGHYLYFYNTFIGPRYGSSYAYGFGARCVRRGESEPLTVDQNGILTVDGKMAFFKFGSVVGFTQQETSWNKDAVLFNPVSGSPDYTTYTEVPVYADADYDDGHRNISDSTYHNGTNIKAGKGDPCKLAGLSATQIQTMTAGELDAYISDWRLPTSAENLSFTGQTGNVNYEAHWTDSDSRYELYYSGGSAGGYFPKGEESKTNNYLPAAGFRNTTGSSFNVGTDGYYWSSQTYDTSGGYYLYFSRSNVWPARLNDHDHGFGARCVRR